LYASPSIYHRGYSWRQSHSLFVYPASIFESIRVNSMTTSSRILFFASSWICFMNIFDNFANSLRFLSKIIFRRSSTGEFSYNIFNLSTSHLSAIFRKIPELSHSSIFSKIFFHIVVLNFIFKATNIFISERIIY